MDVGKLHTLDHLLPFSRRRMASAAMNFKVFSRMSEYPESAAGIESDFLKMSDANNTVELWSKLPPVFRQQGVFRPKVESEVLASVSFTIHSAPPDPFNCDKEREQKKSLAVLGYGLWRWDMLSVLEAVPISSLSVLSACCPLADDAGRFTQDSVQSSTTMYTTQDGVEFMLRCMTIRISPWKCTH